MRRETTMRDHRGIVRGAAPGFVLAAAAVLTATACTPTVRVEAPSEPITINLNIDLKADVRVRLEEKAQEDIRENPEIF